jgi:8-oxo-dGTP pyrophosphatase MutT (NUDIX family)
LAIINVLPKWQFPGGTIEKGKNLVAAAIREVSEETGIKLCEQNVKVFELELSSQRVNFVIFEIDDVGDAIKNLSILNVTNSYGEPLPI